LKQETQSRRYASRVHKVFFVVDEFLPVIELNRNKFNLNSEVCLLKMSPVSH